MVCVREAEKKAESQKYDRAERAGAHPSKTPFRGVTQVPKGSWTPAAGAGFGTYAQKQLGGSGEAHPSGTLPPQACIILPGAAASGCSPSAIPHGMVT